MPIFLDFEGFQHGETKFTIKELSIVDVDKPLKPLYFYFKAPKSWEELDEHRKETYNYQTRHLHHLMWDEGVSRYCRRCIAHHIKECFPYWKNCVFYVMGEQKCHFLQKEFPDFDFIEYNVTFNNLPAAPNHISCLSHPHGDHCALLKCMQLYTHYTTFQ